jgi:hypothetical protein
VLKRDSYPEDLLALVESGGGLMGLYRIQDFDSIKYVINVLKKADLKSQVRALLAQPGVFAKINNGYRLCDVIYALNAAGLIDEIKTLLNQPIVGAKIKNSDEFCSVVGKLKSAGLIEAIGDLIYRNVDIPEEVRLGGLRALVLKKVNSLLEEERTSNSEVLEALLKDPSINTVFALKEEILRTLESCGDLYERIKLYVTELGPSFAGAFVFAGAGAGAGAAAGAVFEPENIKFLDFFGEECDPTSPWPRK